jgi:hypothetical protein
LFSLLSFSILCFLLSCYISCALSPSFFFHFTLDNFIHSVSFSSSLFPSLFSPLFFTFLHYWFFFLLSFFSLVPYWLKVWNELLCFRPIACGLLLDQWSPMWGVCNVPLGYSKKINHIGLLPIWCTYVSMFLHMCIYIYNL